LLIIGTGGSAFLYKGHGYAILSIEVGIVSIHHLPYKLLLVE